MIHIKSVVYCNIALEELVPTHEPASQLKYDRLLADIKKNGMTDPLMVHRVNNKNNVMIGNARYAVTKKLGYEDVPCIVVNDASSIPLRGIEVTVSNVNDFFHSKGLVDWATKNGFIIQARKPGGWIARDLKGEQ